MRFKLVSVLSVLLLVGSNDARPSKLASPEIVVETDEAFSKGVTDDSTSWRPIEARSSSVVKTDSRGELKDRYMDQSLRTVATQLLNVTNTDDSGSTVKRKITSNPSAATIETIKKPEEKIITKTSNFPAKEKNNVESIREINSDISPMGTGYRPLNSKFGYYESSHPGQAMAMTEEELERELMGLSTTRLMTAHKNNPTTTGGISTWILLNSPTTTSHPSKEESKDDPNVDSGISPETRLMTPVEIFESTTKNEIKSVASKEKIVPSSSTTPMERITTLSRVTTSSLKKTTVPRTATTTEKIPKTTQQTSKTDSTPTTFIDGSIKLEDSTTTAKTTITTRKSSSFNRSTLRPKITTPRATNVTSKPMTTKLSRPVKQSSKVKVNGAVGRNSTKSSMETTKNPSTSKIEKVTFRPVHMITTPKSIDNVERPIFVTKIKASLVTDSSSKPSADSQSSGSNSMTSKQQETKLTLKDEEIVTKTNKIPSKVNNVLKVQLKEPVEVSTKLQVEPVRMNPMIERIDDKEKSSAKNTTRVQDVGLENSAIAVKFDFKPEVERIVTMTTVGTSSVATTKRPHKRKKNKLRRRKPTTAAPSTSAITEITEESIIPDLSTIPTIDEIAETLTELGIVDNALQESKIEPESKVTSGTNDKNKKQQIDKPIGTQIYNFLSREVMPSFGVMSLVGLGLGLASYFLYPFSGAIARRNYVVEPNYKYNMDEYGGNYGQSEEEVFSKVLQGMTNQDGKYGGIKDYENNYYRYQQSHSVPQTAEYSLTTRRVPEPSRFSTASATAYRPLETTLYDNDKYRNNEFKFVEPTTTPNYHERRKKLEFVGKNSADRQFVVGNVPKEYGYEENPSNLEITLPITTEIQQNYEEKGNYGHAEALKSNDDYEEIEITPSAVAVEHGPRSLSEKPKIVRRRKRESVIQVIPSRTEIEKEVEEIEKEEPLSNEIFGIIDSVIPGETDDKDTWKSIDKHKNDERHNVEKKASGDDNGGQRIAAKIPEVSPQENGGVDNTIESSDEGTTKMTDVSTLVPKTLETTSSSSTTIKTPSIDEILVTSTKSNDEDSGDSSPEVFDETTTPKPQEEPFNIFNFVKKIAKVKLKLGVAILKHASEGFARYLGHMQKRINGDE